MLTGRHKQKNQHKQGNAFKEQARVNQETGRRLETCAQIQKGLGELNGRKTQMNSYWGGWGKEVMRDR